MEKKTFMQFLTDWSQAAKDQKVNDDLATVQTAYENYVFPTIGLCSNKSKEDFDDNWTKLTPHKFIEVCLRWYEKEIAQNPNQLDMLLHPKENLPGFVLFVFNRHFDAAIIEGIENEVNRQDYAFSVFHFAEWLIQQQWWQESFPESVPRIVLTRGVQSKKPATQARREPYVLRREDLPTALLQELETYQLICQDGGRMLWNQLQQQERELNLSVSETEPRKNKLFRPVFHPIREVTYKHEEHAFRSFWTWCVREKGYSLSELTLAMLINPDLLHEYGLWFTRDNQVTHAQLITLLTGSGRVAKIQNLGRSQRRDWSDVKVIHQLRDLRQEYTHFYRRERRDRWWLEWKDIQITYDELKQLLPYLRQQGMPYVAKLNSSTGQTRGEKQSHAKILWSRQAHILVKALVCDPQMKPTIQQYVEGINIFRQLDGSRHPRYKEEIRLYRPCGIKEFFGYDLPEVITHDLDEWSQVYRPRAEQALQSLNDWLIFWGHQPDALQKVQQRLDAVCQGDIPTTVKDGQAYKKSLEKQINALQNRITAYSVATANFEQHNSFFFNMGVFKPENFGLPLTYESLRRILENSISSATQAVLGKPVWVSYWQLLYLVLSSLEYEQPMQVIYSRHRQK